MPVFVIDPNGVEQGRGWDFGGGNPPPPPPPPSSTIFGFNTHNPPPHDLASKEVWWGGRAPMTRYYNSNEPPSTFEITTAYAPEKRVCYSFVAGPHTTAQIAAGAINSTIRSWVQSIPAGWTVHLVYRHEANSRLSSGAMSASDYVGAFQQLYPVIKNAKLNAGVTVKLACNFMSYQLSGSNWSDSWVPVGFIDLLTFDTYLNPGQNTSSTGSNKYGTATGSGYGTTYPLPDVRFRDQFDIIERLGYQTRWAIYEFNAPGRDWDKTEAGRKQVHLDSIEYMLAGGGMTGGGPPDALLIWEMDQSTGANWDQSYGRVSGDPTIMANALKSYFVNSP